MPRRGTGSIRRHSLTTMLVAVLLCVGVTAVFAAADMNKTLHYYFEAPETGFDPAQVSDHYSLEVISSIFEPLLTYDYLARPQKLVPNTTIGLPEISDGGRRFVFKIKPGISFADSPVFGGKRRELTANDYVYSLQRLVDPTGKAPWDFMLKGKIIGLDEKIEEAKKFGKFDYDKPVAGLQATDRYTLTLRLKRPDYILPYILATPSTGAVAREVVEHYGNDIDAHPVGTGPYLLRSWKRQTHIVLEANPNFRGASYSPAAGAQGIDQAVLKELAGKTFPRIGIIDIRVIESGQAAWLSFDGGDLDLLQRMSSEYVKVAAPGGTLNKKLQARGVHHFRQAEADITYIQFNMEDPVVGGYTLEKIALRRALTMSYNQMKEVSIIRNGEALAAQSPLAPQIVGYDPDFKNVLGRYSPARANALLDVFGYKDCDGDGWRELPDCSVLTLTYLTSTSGSRDLEELFQKGTNSIGIRLEIKKMPFPDLVKSRQAGTYQIAGAAWGADYPDAENFMQLLYGPNAGPANESRFRLKEFDKLYEDIATHPDSPQRNEKLREMSRLVAAYAPWMVNTNRIFTHLSQNWVSGYKPFPGGLARFMYYDIDTERRDAFKYSR
jgi:ABC-type transport system substrate-binding protein